MEKIKIITGKDRAEMLKTITNKYSPHEVAYVGGLFLHDPKNKEYKELKKFNADWLYQKPHPFFNLTESTRLIVFRQMLSVEQIAALKDFILTDELVIGSYIKTHS